MTVITKLKIGAVMVAVTLAVGLIFYAQGLASQRDRLKQELTVLATTNAGLKKEVAANFKALKTREAERQRLETETADLKRQLEVLYAEDKEAGAWASICVPPAVLERLRH